MAAPTVLDTITLGSGWTLRDALPAGHPIKIECATIRVEQSGRALKSAEVSLPRLLFGHNGRVIATQAELDAALAKFAESLAPFAVVPDIRKPIAPAGWAEAVGAEPLVIRQRIQARLAHKPERTRRRYQQLTEAAAANLAQDFSWAHILPLISPPQAVCVAPRRLP